MQVSAKLAIYGAIVFAIVCLGVAAHGFISLREITDPQLASDAKGFAFFWAFLGAVGAGIAWLSRWAIRGLLQDEDAPRQP